MTTKTHTKLALLFAVAGLSIASAKTYEISVPDHAAIASTQLKAGDYRVKVEGGTATLIPSDNKSVEATGQTQATDNKFAQTELEVTKGADGVNHITAIDLGGTKTKLTFNEN
jgi:hypothetical protein